MKIFNENNYLIYKNIIAFVEEPNDDIITSNNIYFYKYIKDKLDIIDYGDNIVVDYIAMLPTEENIKDYINMLTSI